MQRDILPIFCHKTRNDTINEGRNCKYKQLRYKPSQGNRAAFVCTLQNHEVKLSFMRRSPNMLTYQELTLTDAFFFSSEQNLLCMPLIAKDDRRCLIAENVLAPDCRCFSVQLALDIFDIFSRYFSANIYQPHLHLMMHEVH